jgi:hypothetical protein
MIIINPVAPPPLLFVFTLWAARALHIALLTPRLFAHCLFCAAVLPSLCLFIDQGDVGGDGAREGQGSREGNRCFQPHVPDHDGHAQVVHAPPCGQPG